MKRFLLVSAAVLAVSLECAGQEPVTRLRVQAMAAPQPALRYQLLPRIDELNPGNAAQDYLKVFMEQHPFFFGRQAAVDRERFESMPLADLAREKLDGYGGGPLNRADWAARMDSLDWQSLAGVQSGGIEAPPAEVGPLQVLARALHVRLRAEVAGRRFDDAIRTCKTMFALSRHLGEHPTEVADLVGLWVAHLALNSLEEMVQQPNCPNMYWALTDLPSPLVDLRKGVQGEQTMVAALLRPIRTDAPMTESELEALITRISGVISFAREQTGQAPRSIRTALRALANDPETLRAARKRLADSGCKQDLIGKFPGLQLVLLEQKHRYEIERDERTKLLSVPVWQVECSAGSAKAESAAAWPLSSLLPSITKLRAELAELDRQVALLRYVEAIRLYAAAHDGKPAARPADMPVPLPLDPVSGKPFGYWVQGETAHISGEKLPENGKSPDGGVHCIVSVHP